MTGAESDSVARVCRVCGGGRSELRFTQRVRDAHDAEFWECGVCRSLQVDPTWEEEIDPARPSTTDVGSVRRCLHVEHLCRVLAKSGVVPTGGRVLDVGTGSGLLVRLLRDQGFDAYGYEPLRTPFLAGRFTTDLQSAADEPFDLVTVIEVAEHLTDPRSVLAAAVSRLGTGGSVLVSTELYQPGRHDSDWWYLDLSAGEHVTFYSRSGLEALAAPLGCQVHTNGANFHLLSKDPGVGRRWDRALRRFRLEQRVLGALGVEPGWDHVLADAGLAP